jgi:parvulin-like peptidyl-prolyl isomerase
MKTNIYDSHSDFSRNAYCGEWPAFSARTRKSRDLVPVSARNLASLWHCVRLLVGSILALGWVAVSSGANAAPTPAAGNADSTVIARVGDTEVKLDEIRSAIESLDARDQAALARDPSLLSQTVRTLLMRRVVLKEALAKHWDQEPAVATLIQRARDNAVVESYLQSVSKPPDSYPSETELQAAYDARKAQLLVPKQFRLAQIFLALPKNADKATSDKVQAKLETIKKSLHQAGADFGAIAKADSEESESAARGGEIGWLTDNQIQPEVRSQLGSLSKNAVSEPIRLEDGWHIIKVLDVKEAYTPTLDEIRGALAQELRKEKTQSNSQAYLGKLLQQTPVAINELALSKVLNKGEK